VVTATCFTKLSESGFIVRVVLAETGPDAAVMVADPVPMEVARPELSMVATAVFEEVQVTDEVKSFVEPSL